MNHHRALAGAILRHVLQVKPFRQVVVHLDGAQLPLPVQGVTENEIQLRAVEGGFPGGLEIVHPQGLHRPLDGGLGGLPNGVIANVLAGLGVTEAESGLKGF